MSREIVEAVRELERDRNLEGGILVDALRDGLLAAYKKTPGSYRHATVEIDDAGDFRVFAIHMPADLEERLLEEARERTYDELEKIEEETGEKQHTLVTDDDLEIDWDQVPEDQVRREDVTPENFGRIAAQTAKQVIQQRIREAERQIMYEEYVDRVSEVVTGIVQQAGDRNNILVDLGKVEALLPRSEQVDGERYEQGSRIKAVITEVRSGTKGPQVILSRRDPELIKTLFELEVPEIADGLVEIRGVAREPGYRSKIAVVSHAQGVDPSVHAWAPAVPASGWSCRSSAARRSTSFRGTPSLRASSRRHSRLRGCARSTSTTRPRSPRSSSPRTSSRSRSARRA